MKKLYFMIVALCCFGTTKAQLFEPGDEPGSVRTDGIWDDFFLQMDLDMTLQNPYGYDFSKVFPNGKTFGLDIAVGKWFTPQVGYRVKFNWENKLPLLKNDHANWVAPFYEPGVNREKGGYVALYFDELFNMHNFFGAYRPDRTWNLSVYPRVGVNYNFGVSKGALLLGFGVLNTYRLSNRWSVYLDAAYIMTGSGFVGSEKVEGTGTGSNSNGYFSLGIGAQVIDMSLMNPYGCNFSKVIPKGMTFGLNAAFGKRFTPEFALRARVQWDNGLIENKNLEWVAPREDPCQNYKKGGIGTARLDAMLNLTNVIAGYDPEKKWHTSLYMGGGLITQFVESSASPLWGAGLEQTYRLSDKLSLFASAGYQVSTSEGMGYSTTGMQVAAGSNGFFDIDFGVVYDLGRNRFYRTTEEKQKAYAEPMGRHNWSRFILNTVASVGVAYVGKTALKAVIKEERPDHSDNKSFPSGHAAMAFAAARSIDKEFRKESIWIPITGYAAATAIGVERVVNDKHHWYDVVAGAALGVASTELTWWLTDKLFPKSQVAIGTSGNTLDVTVAL